MTIVSLLVAASSAAASSQWTRPFLLAAPVSLDVTPARIAFSAGGATAVGYSVQDMDNPATSSAQVLLGQAGTRFGPSRTPAGEQQILDLAYGPSGLELLAGTSESGRSCCSRVQVLGPVHGPSFGRARTLFSALAGATLARLISLPDRLLAVAGTERGLWVSQSAAGGDRFAAPRRLSGSNQLPQSFDATASAQGESLVAWAASSSRAPADGPRSIYIATGSLRQSPQRQRLALTVAANHQVDEIALAQGAAQPTLAWIESWFGRDGRFHSEAKVSDLAGALRPQTVSSGGEPAAGLSFAADARGDQALSWKACADNGSCVTRVLLRRAGRPFGAVQRPGAIDAAESPVAAVTPGGRALIGWIHSGHVFAASSQSTRMSGGSVVSGTNFATDLTITAAPGGGALAAWTQGTFAQSVVGSDFRGR